MSRTRYLLRRTMHEGMAAARGLVYLAICVAALVSFAVLMPALEYQHVRATEVSMWDVWVSGPLHGADIDAFEQRPGVSRVAPALSLGVDAITGPRTDPDRAHALGSVTAIAYRDADEIGHGPYPDALLLRGDPPGSGELACDWSTARRFGLAVGDIVVIEATPLGRKIEYRGRLAGIYGPSGIVKDSVVMPVTDDLAGAITGAGGAPWTDAFVTTDEPTSLVTGVLDGPQGEQRLAVERDALGHEARSRLNREVGPFFRNTASWVAVAGLAALALWQQGTRLSRRRREYAVLSALGMATGRLVAMDAVEQAMRLAAAAGAGIGLAALVVQELNGLYVPRGALLAALLAIVGTVLGTLAVGSFSIRRRLAREDLSQVLARER